MVPLEIRRGQLTRLIETLNDLLTLLRADPQCRWLGQFENLLKQAQQLVGRDSVEPSPHPISTVPPLPLFSPNANSTTFLAPFATSLTCTEAVSQSIVRLRTCLASRISRHSPGRRMSVPSNSALSDEIQ